MRVDKEIGEEKIRALIPRVFREDTIQRPKRPASSIRLIVCHSARCAIEINNVTRVFFAALKATSREYFLPVAFNAAQTAASLFGDNKVRPLCCHSRIVDSREFTFGNSISPQRRSSDGAGGSTEPFNGCQFGNKQDDLLSTS